MRNSGNYSGYRNCGFLYNSLSDALVRLLVSCLYPLLEADEVSGQSWQLVTVMHGDYWCHSKCFRSLVVASKVLL